MTPYKHALLSKNKRGGCVDDYLRIHEFIDSTKVLCADNRHRILHTHWALDYIILPLFGRSLENSDGKTVLVKEMVEMDHYLPDYGNRFIPTLADFVSAIEVDNLSALKGRVERFHNRYSNKDVSRLLLSPLSVTGQFKALLITHNSWFINTILPQMMSFEPVIDDFDITPSDLYSHMVLRQWMDNGAALPPSHSQFDYNKDIGVKAVLQSTILGRGYCVSIDREVVSSRGMSQDG